MGKLQNPEKLITILAMDNDHQIQHINNFQDVHSHDHDNSSELDDPMYSVAGLSDHIKAANDKAETRIFSVTMFFLGFFSVTTLFLAWKLFDNHRSKMLMKKQVKNNNNKDYKQVSIPTCSRLIIPVPEETLEMLPTSGIESQEITSSEQNYEQNFSIDSQKTNEQIDPVVNLNVDGDCACQNDNQKSGCQIKAILDKKMMNVQHTINVPNEDLDFSSNFSLNSTKNPENVYLKTSRQSEGRSEIETGESQVTNSRCETCEIRRGVTKS